MTTNNQEISTDTATFQKFLDTSQYNKNGILRYERVFGRTFVSTGGKETTEVFLKVLNLKPDEYVLDVGCGIGGSAILMDKVYGARVRGVDLSLNMIELARERKQETQSTRTTFVEEDITTARYNENQFDVIYSRDTILHIKDKQALYSKFLKWLKPGGRLFVSDYGIGEKKQSQEMVDYLKVRGYHLLTPNGYQKLVEGCGFVDVRVKDESEYFLEILDREFNRLHADHDEFIREFNQMDFNDLSVGWETKIGRVREGSQRWVSIFAKKAA